MSILGQAAAILYGTTAPSNTNVIWGETTTNDPATWSIIGFRYYDGANWQPIRGIYRGATAPADTTQIWVKTGGAVQSVWTHDGSNWVNILDFNIVDASSGYTVNDREISGQLLKSDATTQQDITIAAGLPEGTAFRAMRTGTGALRLVAGTGVTINGQSPGHIVEIAARWHSAWAICLGSDEWLIEGYLL